MWTRADWGRILSVNEQDHESGGAGRRYPTTYSHSFILDGRLNRCVKRKVEAAGKAHTAKYPKGVIEESLKGFKRCADEGRVGQEVREALWR